MSRRSSRGGLGALLAVLALVIASGLLVGVSPAAPLGGKIASELATELARGGEVPFIVAFAGRADLSGASRIPDWDARGRFVYDAVRGNAERSQAAARAFLDARGAAYLPLLIDNSFVVKGDARLAHELAARADVVALQPNREIPLPRPEPGVAEVGVDAVEWNIARIKADQVWSMGYSGQGIVVANIDTGVQYDHPALVSHYRGNEGGGDFDHNYNWFDPSHICGPAPCDNNGHGTHTMGTIVGDDGGSNQIGVAPGALWIAAKGCESSSCSEAALSAAADWMLAPTRLDGTLPDPSKRPHLISNSWGGMGGDPWYRGKVQAWVAAGIFPAFAVGGSGPGCATVGSPADYPESFAVGATDSGDVIASFSSRGPGIFVAQKPNVTAPGVNIRSSIPANSYAVYSGTSMATPHSAGLVALVWSAAPTLARDVASTVGIVQSSALGIKSSQCGAEGPPNYVYGYGRVDALAAVNAAVNPSGPRLVVSPTSLSKAMPSGRVRLASLAVANSGASAVQWSLAESPAVAWLAEKPTGGSLAPGQQVSVSVTFNSRSLKPGTYRSTLTVTGQDGGGSSTTVDVPVTLVVFRA